MVDGSPLGGPSTSPSTSTGSPAGKKVSKKQQRTIVLERESQWMRKEKGPDATVGRLDTNGDEMKMFFSAHLVPNLMRLQDVEPAFMSLRGTDQAKARASAGARSISTSSSDTTSTTTSQPSSSNSTEENVLVAVVTFQPVTDALIEFTDDAADMKDHGRENFFDAMKYLHRIMTDKEEEERRRQRRQQQVEVEEVEGVTSGHEEMMKVQEGVPRREKMVLDWSDPATGIPMNGEAGPTIYSEIDGIEQILAFEVTHICGPGGGCRVVMHPSFGSAVYPATGFFYGPLSTIKAILEEF